jgi:hypothetical protein
MTPAPVTEKVMYIAVVLTKEAQRKLFDLISTVEQIPVGWRKIGHHMTVTFAGVKDAVQPGYYEEDIHFGMKCTVVPIGWKMDECGLAVAVVSSPPGESSPHQKPPPAHHRGGGTRHFARVQQPTTGNRRR